MRPPQKISHQGRPRRQVDRDTGSLAVFARKKIVDDVTNPDLEISPNEAEE